MQTIGKEESESAPGLETVALVVVVVAGGWVVPEQIEQDEKTSFCFLQMYRDEMHPYKMSDEEHSKTCESWELNAPSFYNSIFQVCPTAYLRFIKFRDF